MAMPVWRAASHLIQQIVLISVGVVSKCNGRMVGGLFKKYFQTAKKVLPFSSIFGRLL
jgi:hypothetical protein